MMRQHIAISDEDLRIKIRNKEICFGGNVNLSIYGSLHCVQGKRMKKANRVFFDSEQEAIQSGFRPCGHCMKMEYKKWKDGPI